MKHIPTLWRTLLVLTLLLCGSASVHAVPPQNFVAGSLDKILETRIGKPFLMVLWSLECPPCRHEMALLGRTIKADPDFDVVLISTDDFEEGARTEILLAEYGMDQTESWIFADPHTQRLRYEIDPKWYGELPRAYFYDPQHQRLALSGALQPQHLVAWSQAISNDRR